MLNLKCECGNDFQREDKYKNLDFVLAKWKMRYCDSCLKKRVNNAFQTTFPKVIEAIAGYESGHTLDNCERCTKGVKCNHCNQDLI